MNLSERINDTNAAPWVIEEIKKLEAKCLEWDRLHSDATNAEYVVDEEGCVIGRYIDSDWIERGDEISGREPAVSFARLKAEWQADVLETLLEAGGTSNWSAHQIRKYADHLRLQAEKGVYK